MAKQLQLNIPTPCHEDWDAMTPVDKGKFCGSCQKQVVDFTSMSDRQVAEFFKKPSTGSVCGRFMTDQLDRAIEIPKKRIPWVKYFFQVALPAFLVSAKAGAQKTITSKSKVVVSPLSIDKVPVATMGYILSPTPQQRKATNKITKARIVSEEGVPVPFANIETDKSHLTMTADSNGVFELDQNKLKRFENMTISSAGFENKIIPIGIDLLGMQEEVLITLTSKSLLQEVILTSYGNIIRKGSVVGAVSMCRQTIVEKIDSITSSVIKPLSSINKLQLYPNPAVSGSSATISINEIEEGYYTLQVLSISGQLMNKTEIWIDRKARLLNFNLPAVAAGSYFVILANKKTGIKYSEKVIIH